MNTLATSLAAAMVAPAFCLAATASAQTPVPQLSPVQVEGEASPYDVPVSSQAKFTAPLVDTPKTVQVIPQAVIQDTAATSLQDILRNSPGISFGAGEGGQPLADRPFIRGSSSGNNIFVDGLRDPGGQTREVFNLESVEVIKGADSAYGGRGSGGGSINLVTKRARLGSFAEGSLGVGTDNYWRGTADGNWQFNDDSAFRLNIMGTKGDTPGREDVDFERWGVAPSLAFGLGTPTRVTLSYYHLQTDDMPDYGVPLASKIPGKTTSSGILDVGRGAFYGVLDRDFRKTRADIATIEIEHDFSDRLTLRNATRYGETLNDYVLTNPGDGGAAKWDPVTSQYWMKRGLKTRWNKTTMLTNVTELYGKFDTGSLKHSFDVGVEFTTERNKNAGYDVTTTAGSFCPAVWGGVDCTPVYDPNPHDNWSGKIERGDITADSKSNTRSIYAFDTVELSKQWQVSGGVRYDYYTIDGTYTPRGGSKEDADGDWGMFNYQAALVYKPAPNGSIYVSYATASTPPTISGGDQEGLSADTNQLDPEKSSTIEVGTKWDLFDDRLSLTAAIFQNERKDAQIEVDSGVFEQAGKTRVKGLELGFSGNVTPKWAVFGGYTYMDSELVNGAYSSVNEGDQLANTPRNSFSLWTTYKVVPALTVGGGAYYVGKTFGGNQGGAGGGNNQVYMPAYWRFDAMAAYRLTGNVALQLNVLNLTDKEYFVRTNGVHHADYGPGRQFILSANVRY
ncbi:TonB-dependent siderophore receptor [Bordetella sp. BOR01]|uniref:TonB-dependent receptor n=1 Tax=Bordetella sp. BOR01 TaxID=2854779 RepID=UPI001C48147E|nr:TonB-dependent siderophore receptor [Bordetella sp. BOR01]MBV7481893.1 TonB-dependent siderophore receptor [Bordetella sp. BOR01]